MILLLLNIIIVILVFIIIVVYSKLKRFKSYYRNLKRDINKLVNIVQKVRYGQLYLRAEQMQDKELEESLNRLIETVEDRENMIKEYQASLFEKNQSLEKYIESEKESKKFKEDFVATLTHDLKVPVIAELNALDYLLSGRFGELNEKQLEALKLMKSSNEELMELSEVLLETYKLEHSSLVLNKSLVEINEYLSYIVEEMKIIASNNNRELIFKPLEASMDISLDKLQIKRVLKNVIFNAISFSTFDTQITVTLSLQDNFLKIDIKNYGTGISQDELELVFKKYYTSVKKFRKLGTGLGLYLANQIVQAHNGTITADSIEDDTTTFTIKLPVS